MLKSSRSGKRTSSKGQWFFISAVIASGIFLSISVIFKDYFAVDSSAALSDEDFYFSSIKDGLITAIKSDPSCTGENLKEFTQFATDKMARIGYMLNVTQKNLDCNKEMENFHLVLLQSPRTQVWHGERPEIKSVDADTSADEATIKLKDVLDYDILVNVSLFDLSVKIKEIESKIVEIKKGKDKETVKFDADVKRGHEIRLINSLILGRVKFFVL